MNITLLVWVIIGGVIGFVSYGPLVALIGITAGVLVGISDQLSVIVEEVRKDES
ncbi:hypothetical protein SAMN05192534_1524 [Alteribacillus persepolensis]|uniref:Small integral membrane protein n=1 Tax=Alteribacillus persepolensis TaxID=568899 RepID=A0A1G8KJN5_9BACI|nr:hypothetical protein [Alteribacillus persepolensis]SDI43586.1 hypothetical protein SAMN05192534_1524 [Alteribacillus persepolensis]